MALYKHIDFHDFKREFDQRDLYRNSFSEGALAALHDYLDTQDEAIFLDVVRLACEWEEFGENDDLGVYNERALEVLPIESGGVLVHKFIL